MTRKLVLLNLLLIALVTIAAWQIRMRWTQAAEHEHGVLSHSVPPAPAPPAPQPTPVAPVQASSYADVAQKTVFSPDRNPAVVIEKAPEKPVPPFPLAYGIMDLGAGPTAILIEKAGEKQKAYRKGDKVGPFLLASVSSNELVFEWDGKEFKKNLADLKVKPPAPAPVEAAQRNAGISAIQQPTQQLTTPDQLKAAQKVNEGGVPGSTSVEISGHARQVTPLPLVPWLRATAK